MSDDPRVTASPVVLVEDDVDTLELYSLTLESAGYQVRAAQNGADALELVRSLRPKVVVTDLSLPDLGGVSLCEALAREGRSDLEALIVVSGTADDDVLKRVRAAGAREVLSKPCLPGDLQAAVRRVLS